MANRRIKTFSIPWFDLERWGEDQCYIFGQISRRSGLRSVELRMSKIFVSNKTDHSGQTHQTGLQTRFNSSDDESHQSRIISSGKLVLIMTKLSAFDGQQTPGTPGRDIGKYLPCEKGRDETGRLNIFYWFIFDTLLSLDCLGLGHRSNSGN